MLPQPAGSLVAQVQKHTLTGAQGWSGDMENRTPGTFGVRELCRGKRDKEGCVYPQSPGSKGGVLETTCDHPRLGRRDQGSAGVRKVGGPAPPPHSLKRGKPRLHLVGTAGLPTLAPHSPAPPVPSLLY